MAMQVGERLGVNLGLMYARQSAPTAYTRRQTDSTTQRAGAGNGSEGVDSVVLSRNVPRPISAADFVEALETGQSLADDESLSSGQKSKMREDRVFAALVALTLVGEDASGWPGGLPQPTREEVAEARRRLSQRLDGLESVEDAESARQGRVELLRRVGNLDISAFPGLGDGTSSAARSA